MSMIKRATLLFVASESVFFILLILSFLHYRTVHAHSNSGADLLNVARTAKFSFLLVLSSVTVWMGIRNMRAGKQGATSLWLLATIGLGIAFLYGQGTEWWGLISRNVTISRDLFGTTFFTLTGFHGFHVLIGLIMLIVLWGLTLTGAMKGKGQTAADSISIYWHFVDGVWIVVFTVIYLLPLMH